MRCDLGDWTGAAVRVTRLRVNQVRRRDAHATDDAGLLTDWDEGGLQPSEERRMRRL